MPEAIKKKRHKGGKKKSLRRSKMNSQARIKNKGRRRLKTDARSDGRGGKKGMRTTINNECERRSAMNARYVAGLRRKFRTHLSQASCVVFWRVEVWGASCVDASPRIAIARQALLHAIYTLRPLS